jgi:radical SAM protein with 4Fe4S-binding SPASM domain
MSDNILEYDIKGNNSLYFAKDYGRFWVNSLNENLKKVYYETSLTDLRIEITYACNGNCKYCIVYGNEIQKTESLNMVDLWNELSGKDWIKNIKTILLIGGEPMLFFDQIDYLLDRFDGEVRISTNATLITKKIAKRLAEKKASVYLSLDGPTFDDNIMRIYKNGSYMYDDVIRGLHNILEETVKFGIFTVSTKENTEAVVDIMKEFVNKYHPFRIGYSLPHWTKNNDYEVSAYEYRDALLKLFAHRKEIDTEIMQLKWRIKPLWDGKIKRFSCSMHTSQKTILADRTVVRCSKIDHDSVYKNLSNDFFDRNCPVSLADNRGNPCSKCVGLTCCGGGCPYDGLKRFGGAIDRRECIITPPIIEAAINEVIKHMNSLNKVDNGLIPLNTIKQVLN